MRQFLCALTILKKNNLRFTCKFLNSLGFGSVCRFCCRMLSKEDAVLQQCRVVLHLEELKTLGFFSFQHCLGTCRRSCNDPGVRRIHRAARVTLIKHASVQMGMSPVPSLGCIPVTGVTVISNKTYQFV